MIPQHDFYDCHGGPGTTEPPCGACVACLTRDLAATEERLEKALEVGRKMADRMGCRLCVDGSVCDTCAALEVELSKI